MAENLPQKPPQRDKRVQSATTSWAAIFALPCTTEEVTDQLRLKEKNTSEMRQVEKSGIGE